MENPVESSPLLTYILKNEATPPEIPKPSKPAKANELKAQYLLQRGAKQGACAYFPLLRATIQLNASGDVQLVLEGWSNLGRGQVPGVTVHIKLDQKVTTNCFTGRESNDSECGLEDPSEEVDEHHYKHKVSPYFSFGYPNASSAKRCYMRLPLQ